MELVEMLRSRIKRQELALVRSQAELEQALRLQKAERLLAEPELPLVQRQESERSAKRGRR